MKARIHDRNGGIFMKCKVRLTRTVELIVEGKSEEQIQNWLNETTPEDVYLATDGDVDES